MSGEEPLEFLLAVMRDPEAPAQLRVRSAVAAAQYIHTKKSDGGKREEQAARAAAAGAGKYAPPAPPKLVVNNG